MTLKYNGDGTDYFVGKGNWSILDDSGQEIDNVFDVQISLKAGERELPVITIKRYLSKTDRIEEKIIGVGHAITICPKCREVQFEVHEHQQVHD